MKKSSPSPPSGMDPELSENGKVGSSPNNLFITANSIFGHSVQMQLRRNDRLLAPSFKISRMADDDLETELKEWTRPFCHYIGKNGSTSAAISDCKFNEMVGMVSSTPSL